MWSDEAAFRQFSSTAVAAAVEGLGLPRYEPEVFALVHVLH